LAEKTSIEYVGTTSARVVLEPSERSTMAGDENQPVSVGRFHMNLGACTFAAPEPALHAGVSSTLPSPTTVPPPTPFEHENVDDPTSADMTAAPKQMDLLMRAGSARRGAAASSDGGSGTRPRLLAAEVDERVHARVQPRDLDQLAAPPEEVELDHERE